MLLQRANDTAFSAGFWTNQLERLDAYTFIEQDLYEELVDELLLDASDVLPPELEGAALPTTAAARAALLELLREALPADYLQRQTEAFINAAVPYLRGDTDRFVVLPSLGSRLRAVANRQPGGESVVERSFRTLELGPLFIDHLIDRYLAGHSSFGTPPPAARRALTALDRDDAGEWFTRELFDAIEEVRPFLLGETDSFDVTVNFSGREDLTEPLADLLGRDPDDLLQDGYVVTQADLEERLGQRDSPAFRDLQHHFEIFEPGWTFDQQDVFNRAERLDEIDEIRDGAGWILGPLRWGLFIAAALLILAVAALGGRNWPQRLLWFGTPLVLIAGVTLLLVWPAYDAASAEARDELVEETQDWTGAVADERERIIDDLESVIDAAVSGTGWLALPILLIGAAAAATGAGLTLRLQRGLPQGADALGAPPSEDDPAEPLAVPAPQHPPEPGDSPDGDAAEEQAAGEAPSYVTTTPLSPAKTALRDQLRARRRDISPTRHREWSKTIAEAVTVHPAYKSARVVHLFIGALDNEVDTTAIAQHALDEGKIVVCPRVLRDERRLEHRRIFALDELERTDLGLLEPDPDRTERWAWGFNLVLVPGVAFDRAGNRVGFGAGYYDRFLKEVAAPRIAPVFALQVVEQVPHDANDVPVDQIVTEIEVIEAEQPGEAGA